ncbi:MAG: glycosyltransferase [Anaerolineales bacterium]|nr:glycosyltransferase [Anaerolineales bacterium]
MHLVVFTSTYPFNVGGEQAFLDIEIQYLKRIFDRVVLVPKKNEGQHLSIPSGVEVDESYAQLLKKVNWLSLTGRVLTSRLTYRELFSRPSLLLYPSALLRLVRFVAVAKLTRKWVETWLNQNNDESQIIFYTYWFDSSSMGIGLTKCLYPNLHIVSRVHGYDLYEEHYYNPPYWPLRRTALSFLDVLFPDSNAGLNYLLQRYPEYSSFYETALLGVTEAGFTTSASVDGVFRIVSCSFIVPVKRVDLLLEGILLAAQQRPSQKFEWIHLGDGSARSKLQDTANDRFPANAKALFPGYSNKSALMNFYRENQVDVFVNVSATEGTPVSIMEAISCSIPVIATTVGGNSEIVTKRNGILISANPLPQEIANAILEFLDNPSQVASKREGSYLTWKERYNADVNFSLFAKRLKLLGDNK